MQHSSRWLVCSPLAVLIFLVATASAAVVRGLDVPALCQHSDVIARGVVVASRVAWEGRRIVTASEVRILEPLKGDPGASVTVKRIGGTIDGMAMAVPGSATLTVGDEVVLFLQRQGDSFLSLGMGQGVYHVAIDASTGERIARQDLSGLAMLDGAGKPAAPRPTGPVRVVDLLAQIRKSVP